MRQYTLNVGDRVTYLDRLATVTDDGQHGNYVKRADPVVTVRFDDNGREDTFVPGSCLHFIGPGRSLNPRWEKSGMNHEQQQTYQALLSDGRGCEAAYFAAFQTGETPMGADNDSAIGRAALNGLRHSSAGAQYAYSYADCA